MQQRSISTMPLVKTPDWVKDAVFYQIFPDRFARRPSANGANSVNFQPWGIKPTRHGFQGGNLHGILDQLDYLVDLGINAIYFNPVFTSASNHRYHTHDYFQIDPLLGGNAAFHTLLNAAHQRDIRIVLDGVFNHASRGFYQFNHLLECGPESPFVDWFHVYDWPIKAYDGEANYATWWNLPALPKFNTSTPAVREFLWQVSEYWLEQGIDGWRLDVPEEIDDDLFWQEFRRRCKAVNPEAYLVGELWHEAQRWLSGDMFDAQMNYSFARTALAFFGGRNLNNEQIDRCGLAELQPIDGETFAAQMTTLHTRYHPEIVYAQMNMLGSHDTARVLTMLNGDKDALRMVFLCQMTVPGAPNIYYGDEIGLTGDHEPDSRQAFPWHIPHTWDYDLLQDVKQMIALRRTRPALRRGTFSILFSDPESIVYLRTLANEQVIVAFNVAPTEKSIVLPAVESIPMHLPNALDSTGEPFSFGFPVILPGRSGRVWAAPE